eukprot:CCRYP_011778-RA/>CCRYP_011778-RA protein AED:0.33 eAED:0.33 QI:0/0/0/1/0/0/5/0/523
MTQVRDIINNALVMAMHAMRTTVATIIGSAARALAFSRDITLGDWITEPVSLELKEGANPYLGKAYPVPKLCKETMIKELHRPCRLGVVAFQPESEGVLPSFITAKKDGTVCFLTDFRELENRPKISTALQEPEGFTYATTLDLNMGYYTIRLDPNSSEICTVIFPWGKYSYLQLPMGIAGSPDIFQAKISSLMVALEFGYPNLWARCSKVLALLTSLVGECGHTKVTRANKTKKCPCYWDMVHQKAFDYIKTTISKDVVLAYPDYSREFEIYTGALSKQLGSVITQSNRPLETVNSATEMQRDQTRTTGHSGNTERVQSMLWGQRLKVYTGHKNLTQDALGLTSDCVYKWRLLLKEFDPKILYIKGTHNTVVDAISRLDIGPIPSEHENWKTFTKCLYYYTMPEEIAIDTSAYQEEMNLVFANHSKEDVIYPLTVQDIAEAPKLDASMKTPTPKDSTTQLVKSTELLWKDGRMIIPKDLQHPAVSWYCHYLQHPGHTWLEETLRAVMYYKGMQNTIRKYVKN